MPPQIRGPQNHYVSRLWGEQRPHSTQGRGAECKILRRPRRGAAPSAASGEVAPLGRAEVFLLHVSMMTSLVLGVGRVHLAPGVGRPFHIKKTGRASPAPGGFASRAPRVRRSWGVPALLPPGLTEPGVYKGFGGTRPFGNPGKQRIPKSPGIPGKSKSSQNTRVVSRPETPAAWNREIASSILGPTGDCFFPKCGFVGKTWPGALSPRATRLREFAIPEEFQANSRARAFRDTQRCAA